MCGPAGPVVVFFLTFVKLTQAFPPGLRRSDAAGALVHPEEPDAVVVVPCRPEVRVVVPRREQRVGHVEPLVVAAQPQHVRVRHGDGRRENGIERIADVELLHRVAEPVAHVQVLAVVGQDQVRRDCQPVIRAEHLLEVEDTVAVVVVRQPDRARPGRVDERPPDALLHDEVHHERPTRRAEIRGLDHLLPANVPDRDLVAEAARLDAPRDTGRRAERRADAAVRAGQRLEVVHVLRIGLAGVTHRSRAEVLDERTRFVVDLDHAAWAASSRSPRRSSLPGRGRGACRGPSHRAARRSRSSRPAGH